MKTCEVEVWIAVDHNGDYASGTDAESARAQYADDVGCLEDTDGFRLVKIMLTVPLPSSVVELCGTVPADGTAKLTVA